jgi:hypothetical protein
MNTNELSIGFMFTAGTCFVIAIIVGMNDILNKSTHNTGLLFGLILFGWMFYFTAIAIKKSK